jgi:flagellar protein FliO/FliZ
MNEPSILWVLGVLVGVLALVGACAKLFQLTARQARPRPGQTLSLQESIALDPRRRIHLVRCGQRQVMLLTGGAQDLVIGWIPDP